MQHKSEPENINDKNRFQVKLNKAHMLEQENQNKLSVQKLPKLIFTKFSLTPCGDHSEEKKISVMTKQQHKSRSRTWFQEDMNRSDSADSCFS